MKIQYTTNQINVLQVLRQAGFRPIVDRLSSHESWARPIGRSHYPRFHLYVTSKPNSTTFNLHLDQKKATIKLAGLKRHAGEYDSPAVEAELQRLQRWLDYAAQSSRKVR